MICVDARELISADLDGETSERERTLLGAHLEGCPRCRRFRRRAVATRRLWQVHAAPDVPDLTAAIVPPRPAAAAAAGAGPSGRRRGAGRLDLVLRTSLGAVAVLQLVAAAPDLVEHADFSDDLHALHHLNAWAVAFAVGMAVVAWQPWRVRGLLPLAAALGGVMAFTVGLDMANRHRVGMPATAHLVELAGLVLLWALARRQAPPGPGARRPWWARWSPGGGGADPATPVALLGSRARPAISARSHPAA